MSNKNLGQEPACPCHDSEINYEGFSKREMASMTLKVADSGTDWLDEMIKKSNRQELAKAAMQAIIIGNRADECALGPGAAKDAYAVADAMIKAGGE